MFKHTLTIGMFDRTTKQQELTQAQFEDVIINTVGDCTISSGGVGCYTHHDGTQIKEPNLLVTVFNKQPKFDVTLAKQLKKQLNQETIIVTSEPSDSEFI